MEKAQSVVEANEEIPIKKEKKMQKNYALNASSNKHTKKKNSLWNAKIQVRWRQKVNKEGEIRD